MKKILLLLSLLFVFGIVNAAEGDGPDALPGDLGDIDPSPGPGYTPSSSSMDTGALDTVMCDLTGLLENLLGPLSFLLIVAAALVYAGGQLGDAKVRAKATG